MSDFEYEFQMASMNGELNREMDTIFMMTSKIIFLSVQGQSKEVASFGCVTVLFRTLLKKS